MTNKPMVILAAGAALLASCLPAAADPISFGALVTTALNFALGAAGYSGLSGVSIAGISVGGLLSGVLVTATSRGIRVLR